MSKGAKLAVVTVPLAVYVAVDPAARTGRTTVHQAHLQRWLAAILVAHVFGYLSAQPRPRVPFNSTSTPLLAIFVMRQVGLSAKLIF
jgi:hypothetical protein